MKRKIDPKDKRASLALTCECQFVEAAGEGGEKTPRFSMTAYTGGPMSVGYWDAPVVIDLAGLAIPSRHIPIRLQHDPEAGVGHTDRLEVAAGELVAEGVISRATDAARDVVESARRGFPWQASVGAAIKKYEFVKGGQSAVVNGRSVAGPVYIMREATLGEISFVDLGADSATSVSVAAHAAQTTNQGDPDMTPFEKWLQAMGLVLAELGDEQKAKLQAKFEAETAPPPAPVPPVLDPVADTRKAIAAEVARCAAVRKACAGNGEIEAKAIAENWTPEKAELEVLRASRIAAPAVVVHGREPVGTQLLQCAVDQALHLPDAEKRHPAPVVEAAHKRFRGRLGLNQLILEAARANGYTGDAYRVDSDVMRYAFQPRVMASGFSTVDISGILSTTANKALLDAFLFVEATWRNICAVRSVNDFKAITSYRMTADAQFVEVGPGGEIQHGDLADESFTNQAKTYGRMFGITRQDIVNDDLGALTAVPAILGRGAGLKLNDVFWTAFMDNSSFFTGTGKYLDGSTTALSVDALTAAEAAFLNKVDANSKPLGVNPAIMLVPPALSATAQQLYKGSELRDTNSSKQYLVVNPHAGKYRVEVSRYLSNSAYTGYSAKAWYLLADPRDIPTIEVVFLNGKDAPTVETEDADFNTLGVQMRGFFDFGCTKQDARGGLKVKGEA